MRAQVVLLQDDRILLAQHRRGNGTFWVLPGGAVEAGETPEEAALREVFEETGLAIRLERLLFVDGPRRVGSTVIKDPRYTFFGKIIGGRLECIEENDGTERPKGYLCGASWMPFDAPEFDEPTLDTLHLVKQALRST